MGPLDVNASDGPWWLFQCTQTTFRCSYEANISYQSGYRCCDNPLHLFDVGPANYLSGESFPLAQFPVSSSSSLSSTATASTTISSSSMANPSTTDSSVSTPNSSPSPPAEAGIEFGAAIGVVGVLAGLVSFRHSPKQRLSETGDLVESMPLTWQWSNQEGAGEGFVMPEEADSNARVEMEGINPPSELSGGALRAELDGNYSRRRRCRGVKGPGWSLCLSRGPVYDFMVVLIRGGLH